MICHKATVGELENLTPVSNSTTCSNLSSCSPLGMPRETHVCASQGQLVRTSIAVRIFCLMLVGAELRLRQPTDTTADSRC